jgi:excisionase family DNA binding protein
MTENENSTTGDPLEVQTLLPKLYSVQEVAAALSVSKGAVYNLLRDGQLPSLRVRSLWKVTHEDLEKYIRNEGNRPHHESSQIESAWDAKEVELNYVAAELNRIVAEGRAAESLSPPIEFRTSRTTEGVVND